MKLLLIRWVGDSVRRLQSNKSGLCLLDFAGWNVMGYDYVGYVSKWD